jgi:hypothetical protein
LTEKRGFRKDEPFSERAFRLESPLGKGFGNSEPSLFRFGFDAILYLSLPPGRGLSETEALRLGGLPERLALLVEGFRKRRPFFGRGLSEKDALFDKGFRKRVPFFCQRAFGRGCPFAKALSLPRARNAGRLPELAT